MEYEKASQCYELVFKMDPSKIQGREYYSSALYSLKKLDTLVSLSHDSLKKYYFKT